MRSITNEIQRLNIGVSETRPIKVVFVSYPHRRELKYDIHFSLELGIVTSGVVRRHYPGYSRLVGRGQVWFCGMWEPHGFEVVKAPCTVMVLLIWPPLLAQLRFAEVPEIKWTAPFTVKPALRPQITSSKKKISLEQAARLKRLIAYSMPAEKAQVKICLLNILAIFLDSLVGPKFMTKKTNPSLEHWNRLNRAVQLVFESRAFVSTSRAARICGLNRNVFSRLFEKWMGIRFADFALRFRLKLAADQLLSGSDPMKAVARQWGFTDASHLHRVFRQHHGCLPSEFRRQINI